MIINYFLESSNLIPMYFAILLYAINITSERLILQLPTKIYITIAGLIILLDLVHNQSRTKIISDSAVLSITVVLLLGFVHYILREILTNKEQLSQIGAIEITNNDTMKPQEPIVPSIQDRIDSFEQSISKRFVTQESLSNLESISDKRITSLEREVQRINDNMQGLMHRLTKLFELLTVATAVQR